MPSATSGQGDFRPAKKNDSLSFSFLLVRKDMSTKTAKYTAMMPRIAVGLRDEFIVVGRNIRYAGISEEKMCLPAFRNGDSGRKSLR
jgi:hypothetical protein